MNLESLNHFKILIFSDFSSMGVGLENVNFCHPLQVANFSMLLVQNSLHCVNIATFESNLGVFLFIVQDRYVSKN